MGVEDGKESLGDDDRASAGDGLGFGDEESPVLELLVLGGYLDATMEQIDVGRHRARADPLGEECSVPAADSSRLDLAELQMSEDGKNVKPKLIGVELTDPRSQRQSGSGKAAFVGGQFLVRRSMRHPARRRRRDKAMAERYGEKPSALIRRCLEAGPGAGKAGAETLEFSEVELGERFEALGAAVGQRETYHSVVVGVPSSHDQAGGVSPVDQFDGAVMP